MSVPVYKLTRFCVSGGGGRRKGGFEREGRGKRVEGRKNARERGITFLHPRANSRLAWHAIWFIKKLGLLLISTQVSSKGNTSFFDSPSGLPQTWKLGVTC